MKIRSKPPYLFALLLLSNAQAFAADCPKAVVDSVKASIVESQKFLASVGLDIAQAEYPQLSIQCKGHHPRYDALDGQYGTLHIDLDPTAKPLEASIIVSHEWMHVVAWRDSKKQASSMVTQSIMPYMTKLPPGDSQRREQARYTNQHFAAICFSELIADLLPLFVHGDRDIISRAVKARLSTADERSFSKTVDINTYSGWVKTLPSGEKTMEPQLFFFPLRAWLIDETPCFDTTDIAQRAVCFKDLYTHITQVADQVVSQVTEYAVDPKKINLSFMSNFSMPTGMDMR